MSIRHIAIAGHIGVGKSSLTQILSQAFQIEPFHEPNLENPFLARFYQDMPTWAFRSQVFFLVHKFNAHRAFLEKNIPMIQDRTIYEDAEVFAQHLCQSQCMSLDEFKTYSSLYEEFIQLLPPPNLMIYLRAQVDTLFERIQFRGRPEEKQIPREYMESLHSLYEQWFEKYDRSSKLVIDVDDLDFVHDPKDQQFLVEQIRDHLNQNFEMPHLL